MKSRQFNYLDIGEKCTMKEQLNINRYTVWDSLFRIDQNSVNSHVFEKDDDKIEDEIY